MVRLGVNIDHVATVRQARRAHEPDPVAAAVLAILGGADGITIHLREDRRHIQDRDLHLLRQIVPHRLNLEMAAVDAIVDIACAVKPDEATLVPERREELTTEGGLDVVKNQQTVARAMERLKQAGIPVSLFIDPDPLQIETAKLLAAHARAAASRASPSPGTAESPWSPPATHFSEQGALACKGSFVSVGRWPLCWRRACRCWPTRRRLRPCRRRNRPNSRRPRCRRR